MQGKTKAIISALNDLKETDFVVFSELKTKYGDLWAIIFDELRYHKVVTSPGYMGRIEVNQNYIAPALEHYTALRTKETRANWAFFLSWAAIAISIVHVIVSVLLSTIWK